MPDASDATLLGAAEIRELAARHGIRPTKQWGQNFVVDANTVRKIVRVAGVGPDDVVVEVGPGLGSLTLALLPVVIVVVLAEISEGGLDPRVLAVLGVLSAINAVLRGLSPGTAGVELVFFVLILAGRVFGPGFGFVLGCTSLFASALLTGGVHPEPSGTWPAIPWPPV